MKIFVYARAKLVLEPLLQPTEKVETMLVISVFGDTHIYVYIGRKIFLIITRVSRDRYRHVVFEKVIKKNNKINKSVLRSLEDSWQDKKKGKNEKKRKEKEKNKLNHPTFATRN